MVKKIVVKMPHKSTIEVSEHSLTIRRKGLISAATHGLKGDKTIPFKNITAVQLKKPGMNNGYIQFSILGGNEGKGGYTEAISDENTVMFLSRKTYKQMVELKETIESYIYSGGNTNPSSPVSTADEIIKLKQLLDDGIITNKEFDKKKKELLG